jgi:hypothetical protein
LDFIDNQNSCPGTQYLSGSGSNIEVFLFDALGTKVTGDYLEHYLEYVNLTYTGNVQVSTIGGNFTALVNSTTGGAMFYSVDLQGHNNSTARLLFETLSSVSGIGCSISLLGCPEGYVVQTEDTFDTCKQGKNLRCSNGFQSSPLHS